MSSNLLNIKQHRQKIRNNKRSQRKQLSKTIQHTNAKKVCYFLQKTPEFLGAKNIAFYLCSDGEVNLELIIQYAQKTGKNCFLPCIEKKTAKKLFTFAKNSTATEKQSMVFRRYTSQKKQVKNIFGIYEPQRNNQHIPSHQIDLVVLPLVSFDKKGNRIGMGGGFYDREFNYKRKFPYTKPDLVGIAHYCQMSEDIPHQTWDVPLKYVVTENGVMRTRKNHKHH